MLVMNVTQENDECHRREIIFREREINFEFPFALIPCLQTGEWFLLRLQIKE